MSNNNKTGLPTEVSYNEAVEESKRYFDGDELAATVWVSKYALKTRSATSMKNRRAKCTNASQPKSNASNKNTPTR